MIYKIASCDVQGTVYIDKNSVYRHIPHTQVKPVLEILEAINNSALSGIIQTEICTDKEIYLRLEIPVTDLILKHRKITYISYPHEWCALMLKDAALFHLEITQTLMNHNLYLKDSHPWNILFDKCQPILVDFTSIVSQESLLKEEYLE